MRRPLVILVAFAAGFLAAHYVSPHRPATAGDLAPVEVYCTHGVNARLVAYRVTEDGEDCDLSACPDDARPLWRITFQNGRVGYFLTELTP